MDAWKIVKMEQIEESDKLFLKPEDGIPYNDIKKFKNLIEKNAVIGIELEAEFQRLPNQTTLAQQLGVTNTTDMREVSELGVQSVAYDGSLGNGWEVRILGLNEPFHVTQQRITKIQKILDKNTAKYSKRAGIHYSVLLLQNYSLPEIITANIWNIVRAFSGALFYISSGHEKMSPQDTFIVRSGIQTYAKPHLSHSPTHRAMRDIISGIGKYSQCNLSKTRFRADQQTKGLFVEFRGIDNLRTPSAITSLAYLYKAIVYKAVEFSEFGIASVEKLNNWTENKKVTQALIGGAQTEEDLEILKQHANHLLKLLTPSIKILDGDSLPVLQKLADEPVSLRITKYRKDKHWKVEKELQIKQKKEKTTQKIIRQIITLQVIQAKDTKEWKQKVANELQMIPRNVEYHLTNIKKKSKTLEWDENIGSYIIIE